MDAKERSDRVLGFVYREDIWEQIKHSPKNPGG